MATLSSSSFLFFVFLLSPLKLEGSFFPLLDHRWNYPLADRYPYRTLEHVPFPLDLDEHALVSTARVDWKETSDSHQITIDVPGLKQEELKVELEDNRVLRVSGERKREEEKRGERWHCVERVHGKFWRQFRLPENADMDTVKAKLHHGVLTVSMTKLSPDNVQRPRVVKIGVEEVENGGEQVQVGL